MFYKRHNLRIFSLIISSFLFMSVTSPRDQWVDLLDQKLSKWETYLSFPIPDGYRGGILNGPDGKPLQPIGYNKDPEKVFSVVQEKGSPVLRISGQIYGCLFTKKEYSNFHLQLKVKFGSKKWPPRLKEPKDSGILYFSQGPCGVDYWKSWMVSQEFQIIEESIGDYWCIANSQATIRSNKENDLFKFDPSGNKEKFGSGTSNGNFCKASHATSNHPDEWHTLDLYCFDGRSLHVSDQKVVMALSDSKIVDSTGEQPLTKGKIQLQSEAAEVFFKDIRIREIDALPSDYKNFFN